MIERRPLPLVLTLIAWCCLAVPWQTCGSECRGGGLQPLFHGCHTHVKVVAACECDHHHAVAPEVERGGGIRGDGPAGRDEGGDDCGDGCELGDHVGVVLPQTTPGSQDDAAGDGGHDGLDLVTLPLVKRCAFGVGAASASPDRRAVGPPSFELAWMIQLRGDVLLL